MTDETQLYPMFEKDLEVLKTTRLSVIPGRVFYLGIAKRMGMVFLSFFSILMVETILTVSLGMDGHPYENYTLYSGFIESFCIAGVWALLSYISVKNYTIFRFHYYDKLNVAPYIDKKITQLAIVVLTVFTVISLFTVTVISPGAIAGGGVLASIISFIAAFILINAEVSRIGMNPLSHIIVNYFEKQEENTLR